MHRPPAHIQWPPEKQDLSTKNILLSAICSLATIGLVGVISQYTLNGYSATFMVASMGASAVLLFVTPASPLSHPWSFVGGHLVSAFIGISCVKLIPDLNLAGAVAVSGSILAMYYLRCLHPPGGATALLTVYGGDAIHALGYQFLASPLLLNLTIVVICTMAYWKVANIHQRQAKQSPQTSSNQLLTREETPQHFPEIPFRDQDLDRAISSMDTFVDITKEDLKEIFAQAIKYSRGYQLNNVPCREFMVPATISVESGTRLNEAWQLFKRHDINGIPVVDAFQRLIGIVTVRDFIRHANESNISVGKTKELSEQISQHIQQTPGFESEKPEVVGQIMSNPVIFARENDLLGEIMPLFSQHKIKHIPVVDEKHKLKGMLVFEKLMKTGNTL